MDRKKVKKIIAESIGCTEEEVLEGASLIDDLGIDELDKIELVMALEEELNIQIPDEDADKLQTVKDVFDCVEAKEKE